MNKNKIKTFAKNARTKLINQVKGKLEYVLNLDSSEIKNKENQIQQLKNEIGKGLIHQTPDEVIEKVAYTWFNRLIALRFMDVNNYHTINMKILSAQEGFSLPEILQEAKRGNIDDKLNIDRDKVNDLIDGKIISKDAQSEVYQMILVAVCNYYNKSMPFMFEKIEDYTELLLPDNLLTDDSIIKDILDNITDEDCLDVEIIGWLYQFYISDKKDQVFEGLKKNVKITPQNIPAATQLFTPHWIVRYMVENSLGRLWLENKPNSKLKEHMKYYIDTENSGEILKISSPEEIKIIDPCCGSGHILVYAFDLLTKIYEEEGYDTNEIPYLILEKNLYGIDIDDRAASLANFALIMKARGYYKRFFKKDVETNVIAMENDSTIDKFKEAKNFGSLIEITTEEYESIKVEEGTLFAQHQKGIKKQALLLSQKYHCVITNPPYMGGKGMNNTMSDFVKKNYPDSKSDLMTCFIYQGINFTKHNGLFSYVTLDSWMFLSTYEQFRKNLLSKVSIDSLIHIGWNTFPEGHTYNRGVAFTLINNKEKNIGIYINLSDVPATFDKKDLFLKRKSQENFIFLRNKHEFERIPGSPIAYWVSEKVKDIFDKSDKIGNNIELKAGLSTGDNNIFQKKWFEVKKLDIGLNFESCEQTVNSHFKWYPCNSGGEFRKWYGNNDIVINWKNNGFEIKNFRTTNGSLRSAVRNSNYYFMEGITWTKLSSSNFAVRYKGKGFIFDDTGRSGFIQDNTKKKFITSFLCSKITFNFLSYLNPTMTFTNEDLSVLPIIFPKSDDTKEKIDIFTQNCIDISKEDWDNRETSWDFTKNELLKNKDSNSLEQEYKKYYNYWFQQYHQLHKNEEELNRLFIDIYELQDELTPDVELKDITILKDETTITEDNQVSFKKDVITKQFISYAVGCMLGRYSPDKDGLILANQGETFQDFLAKVGLMNQTIMHPLK